MLSRKKERPGKAFRAGMRPWPPLSEHPHIPCIILALAVDSLFWDMMFSQPVSDHQQPQLPLPSMGHCSSSLVVDCNHQGCGGSARGVRVPGVAESTALIHRDLSPRHFLRCGVTGVLFLIDFGFAVLLPLDCDLSQESDAVSFSGSSYYAPTSVLDVLRTDGSATYPAKLAHDWRVW